MILYFISDNCVLTLDKKSAKIEKIHAVYYRCLRNSLWQLGLIYNSSRGCFRSVKNVAVLSSDCGRWPCFTKDRRFSRPLGQNIFHPGQLPQHFANAYSSIFVIRTKNRVFHNKNYIRCTTKSQYTLCCNCKFV